VCAKVLEVHDGSPLLASLTSSVAAPDDAARGLAQAVIDGDGAYHPS